MAQTLYIAADPSTGKPRATMLGCGWMPTVPPQYANVATAPCVILSGAGQTVVLSDGNGQLLPQTVATALAPILAAEKAANDAAALLAANAQTLQANAVNALAGNTTFLAIGSPTAAQVAAQVKALTRQVNALIRLVGNQLDSTSGT